MSNPESNLPPSPGMPPTAPPQVNLNDFLTEPPRPRRNGMAIVSLITGLIGCLGVTAIVAVITGILGIRRANRPEYNGAGKGFALTGLILGIVFLLVWALILPAGGLAVFGVMKGTEAPRQLAKEFVGNLATNDIDAAMGKVQPGSFLTRDYLQSLSEQMDLPPEEDSQFNDWGRFHDLNGNSVSLNTVAGVTTFDYSGTARFDNAVKGFRMTEIKEGETWKVTSFEFRD